MPSRKSGLGDNVNVLLSQPSIPIASSPVVQILALDRIEVDPDQPRRDIPEGSLESLSASIKQHGVLQPIVVRPIADRRYRIVAGERRFRASQLAGLNEMPVVVRSLDNPQQQLVVAMVENLQREDLNVIDQAQGLLRLVNEFGLTHEAAASLVGKKRATVSNLLRLLQLAPSVQAQLIAGELEMGHARALLRLPLDQQPIWAQRARDAGYSVRDTERAIQRHLSASTEAASTTAVPLEKQVAEQRQQVLGNKLPHTVTVKPDKRQGYQVQIRCSDLQALDALIERL